MVQSFGAALRQINLSDTVANQISESIFLEIMKVRISLNLNIFLFIKVLISFITNHFNKKIYIFSL